ncbi:AAA family ATPase [Risungbinella massiliensis]|uniref:AAA family ATPase n=1 Tax=Risungbinella massiliensis TaxID=1329796 RepID=UPI000ADAC43B|nr:AAA family ATPase [Risungbinella massiliensis]
MFVITGIMASGKSTVAQLLAERLDQAVHVRGDTFRKMVVTGRKEFLPNPSSEAMRQLRIRYQLTASVADTYFEAGFHVVVQDVIIGPMLEEFISLIKSRPLFLVVLTPNEQKIAEREMARQKTGYGLWSISELNNTLQTDTPKIGMWLDTTELTPDETVEEILKRAAIEGLLQI